MSRIRRRGLRREPGGGWPLDELFVGIATLRVTRELFRQKGEELGRSHRAWDLALWSGVTPQGAADSLDRLERMGLVKVAWSGPELPPGRRPPPGQAKTYRLDPRHPLYRELNDLFYAERQVVREASRKAATNPPGMPPQESSRTRR